jgi:hypothetical protein
MLTRVTIKRTAAAALLMALLIMCAAPAMAEPSISARWGGFDGPWPVQVVISDCKRLNLRSTPQLNVEWNIVAYPPSGTILTAIGRDGSFIVVQYNGIALYAYAAYLVPTKTLPAPTPPPQTYYPPIYTPPVYRPPYYYRPPVYTPPTYPVYPTWPVKPSKPSKPHLPPWWCY